MVQAIARLKVSSSNPSLCMCAYFIKKNYTSIVEVLWWWPVSWNIFLFRCFQVFSNFFIFSKMICWGGLRTHLPLQIDLYGRVSSWSDPTNIFVAADTLPLGSTSRHHPVRHLISLANRNKPRIDLVLNGRCTCSYLFNQIELRCASKLAACPGSKLAPSCLRCGIKFSVTKLTVCFLHKELTPELID